MWNKAVYKRINARGFTIVELLVTITIFLTIGIIGGNFIVTGFRATTFAGEQEEATTNARRAMEIMTRHLRGTNNSEQGDYPLNAITGNNLVFFSDIEYDGKAEMVQYVRVGNSLKMVTTPPGPTNDYNMPSATTTLADYVNNPGLESIFTYYDNNRNITADVDEIRLIKILLKINVTPERAPSDFVVETDVHLRNLKDNL